MANAKDKLLDAAVRLMQARGYSATTVDELCEAAGVAKGSFYHFFGSKEDLAVAALDHYIARNSAILMNGSFREEADPRKRCLAFVDHVRRNAGRLWEHGCMLSAFSVELSGGSPRLQKRVAALFTGIAKNLEPLFAPLAGRGGGDAAQLAEQFLLSVEGGVALAKGYDQPERIERSLKYFRAVLESLCRG